MAIIKGLKCTVYTTFFLSIFLPEHMGRELRNQGARKQRKSQVFSFNPSPQHTRSPSLTEETISENRIKTHRTRQLPRGGKIRSTCKLAILTTIRPIIKKKFSPTKRWNKAKSHLTDLTKSWLENIDRGRKKERYDVREGGEKGESFNPRIF